MIFKSQERFRILRVAVLLSLLLFFISIPAESSDGLSVTLGSRFTIFAADVGIDQFSEKPLVFIQYTENGDTRQRNLKVIGPSQFPSTHITCEWSLSKVAKGSYNLWIQPKDGNPIPVPWSFNVTGPVLSRIFKNAYNNRVILTGRFFGVRAPSVRLTYVDSFNAENDKENIVEIECNVLRPLAFPNGDGDPGRSCMDVETGESRVEFDLPDSLPENMEITITLENRIGSDSAIFESGQRYSAELNMAVYPENAGSTDPPAGEPVQVNTDFPVEISAVPAKGYHFVRWDGTENAVIPDKVSADTTIDVWWNATVTAHFEKNPTQIEFDGIMSAAGVRYVDNDTGETISQAALSWNPAHDDNTPVADIRYHIYRGNTDDVADVYQEHNLITTISGRTEAIIDVPLSNDVNYFLVVAEDSEGNFNRNHRLTKVVQQSVEFEIVPKVLSEIVSSQINFNNFGTIWFDGDYTSSFHKGDIILLEMGYWEALKVVNEVVVQDGITYLDAQAAPFDSVIGSGTLETETYLPWIDEVIQGREAPGIPFSGFPSSATTGLETEGQSNRFSHSEVIDQNTTLDYSVSFKPTLKSRAEYVSGDLERISISLKGTFRLKGKLESVFSGDNVEWDKRGMIKKIAVARYYLGIIPVQNEVELVLNGYMQIKGPKDEHIITDFDFEKEIMFTAEWDSINGWNRKDESREMTFDVSCYPDNPGDIAIDFIISPDIRMTYNSHSIFEYSLRPQADIWASKKGSESEFQKFDIAANARTGAEISYGLFSQALTNTWKDVWEGPDKSRQIFSLPQMSNLYSYPMYVSEQKYIRIYWREGINNSVLSQNGADIWWHTTLDGIEYPYLSLSGSPVYDADNQRWYQETCFLPKRVGTYNIKVMMKGDGFLGDLGTVSQSFTVEVKLPPFPN